MVDGTRAWDDELTHVLWRAQNAAHRRVHEALDDLDVTATQLGLAVHLDQLGPLSAADLSRRFHIAPQSIGTALNRLEKLDWVRRRTHPVHGRVVLYELTETGLAGVARGREAMATTNADITSGLTDDEVDTLIGLLRRITTGIDGPDFPVVSAWPVRT
ncbi:MarR family winged helix-turn-helix transcriptional regulator [Nocardia vaccinii]|uniref:MarR family winged helix-turn-helix transcriptional regulator n=1 Tax=Nocardia vaccinii TaxID=1822 RepID=UPI000833D706|nr:MarR family transcriptional regulator [Nocardia vaccinii]